MAETVRSLGQVLAENLSKGSVDFAYRKKTGELRIATGTTNLDQIPEENHPKGERVNTNAFAKPYWDSNVQGWRCYNPNCVVWVDGVGQEALTLEEHEQISVWIAEH